MAKATSSKVIQAKRSRVSQADVPAYNLEDALRVSSAIVENYGSSPTKPLNVAQAMDLSPNSSHFKMLTGASIAYGLTDGGYNAGEISLTDLARTIHTPLEEGADFAAKVEAFLMPRIIKQFMDKYNDSPFPRDDIAVNVLVDMGVPNDRAKNTLETIVTGAESLNLLTEIKSKKYVNLENGTEQFTKPKDEPDEEAEIHSLDEVKIQTLKSPIKPIDSIRSRKVFITHGKNRSFIDPIKKLLAFGEMEAVVSVEKQSVSQPVPDKVMNDMRACGAAIIHIESEMKLLDADAEQHVMLNPNVLIEIGAAMALYNRRFILLVREGVTLPSNLQGLFQVRYSKPELDGDTTIRLLEAIKELKEIPLSD